MKNVTYKCKCDIIYSYHLIEIIYYGNSNLTSVTGVSLVQDRGRLESKIESLNSEICSIKNNLYVGIDIRVELMISLIQMFLNRLKWILLKLKLKLSRIKQKLSKNLKRLRYIFRLRLCSYKLIINIYFVV